MKKDIEPGQALKLAEMVEYQDKAVISRTLIKGSCGSITLFCFDKGQSISEHTASFDALVHIIEGRAEITIDGMAHQLDQGHAILMPANIPHSLQAITRFKMLLIMMKE